MKITLLVAKKTHNAGMLAAAWALHLAAHASLPRSGWVAARTPPVSISCGTAAAAAAAYLNLI